MEDSHLDYFGDKFKEMGFKAILGITFEQYIRDPEMWDNLLAHVNQKNLGIEFMGVDFAAGEGELAEVDFGHEIASVFLGFSRVETPPETEDIVLATDGNLMGIAIYDLHDKLWRGPISDKPMDVKAWAELPEPKGIIELLAKN